MRHLFQGTLTHADSKQHIAHHFDVPDGATRLHISFVHQPERATGADYANQVSMSLFDPNGSRGARHNNPDQAIRLSVAEATPGYVPGPIIAGQWTVVVDTHRILPPDPLEYTITVEVSSDPISEAPLVYTAGTTADRGAGWYRGDLHGHTLHSDGKWDVPDFVQYARDYQLDFVTLTDHNTVSGLAQLDSLRDDAVLTMGGMELTTYHGHALALGTRDWQEWRTLNGATMTDLARAIIDKGILYVIAHPRSPGDPRCTGCRWEFDDMMPGVAPAVEVWNGIWHPYNEEGLQLYYQWLNAGHKLVATAGTDIHGQPPADTHGAALNVVYAEALSEAAIIAAIKRGHLYLSSAPDLRLIATAGETHAMMGDTLRVTDILDLKASWENIAADDTIRLIVNGAVHEALVATSQSEKSWALDSTQARWALIEVRGANDILRAITNPIFFTT